MKHSARGSAMTESGAHTTDNRETRGIQAFAISLDFLILHFGLGSYLTRSLPVCFMGF